MSTLNHAQRAHLFEHGYVHIPGVVPRVMIDAAMNAINGSLGRGIDPAQLIKFQAQSFCPELQREAVITDLFNRTPAADYARQLIGEIKAVSGAQIALRFPTPGDPPTVHGPHLDGMYTPTNGVPAGTIASFTMLLGVMLSDVPEPFMGNLAVWPGTHRIFERYFCEHGPEALLEGMPPIEMPKPVQMLGRAGDIVLCHYQLAHTIAQNASPHIRYALYFRLHETQHAANWKQAMTDIWLEWAGMRDFSEK
jgi:hypothetical protein